jgi:hypothetical protein
MKILGKDTYAYVSFPNRCLYLPKTPLNAASLKPHLTLAIAAVVTLAATLLVNHRVTATLLTKITSDA